MSDATATNRLAGESSPYLLLHAGNPVDWYPWGEEALARARDENKPIFLSVGYSTCYWCHVMERESFSDPAVAQTMNERFVNIKVDREERPDVDEIYMTATQILAGQGGWPNSVFLTPALEPFYAGTYFPPQDRHGLPGFPAVLAGLADAWESRREEVDMQAAEVAQAMRRILEERFAPGEAPPGPEAAFGAYRALEQGYDPVQGGFGGAPKFPSPANLFLLAALAGHPEAPRAQEMLDRTLHAMAEGGIYDQLAGGFHRYSTDARWRVPHFEKMLYDNGLLLELYAQRHQATGSPEMARIARETAEFLAREMTSPDGALWSAIDAETDGREGAYYVWRADELREILGEEDFAFLAGVYGFDGSPSFEGTEHVLYLPHGLAEQAERRRVAPEALLAEIAPLRAKLLAARDGRERPATDDKVLADWNGMAIRGLALAGQALGEPRFVAQAVRAADRVLATMRPAGGPLLHASRHGEGRVHAFLSDYAFLVRGLLALHAVTGEARHLAAAVDLAAEQEERLAHPAGGWYNAAGGDDLLVRSQEIFDGATPAANGVAVLAQLELAAATGEAAYRERAGRALAAFSPMIERAPEAVKTLALAAWIFGGGTAGIASGEAETGAPPPVGTGTATPAPQAERNASASPGADRPAAGAEEALVQAALDLGEPDDEGWRQFALKLAIAPGWHLNAHDTGEELLTPTSLTAEGAELADLAYPQAEVLELGFRDLPLHAYQGTVEITGSVRGGGQLVLSYQACDDHRCARPARLVIPLGP